MISRSSTRTVVVEPRDSLLDALGDSLNLTESKKGCDETVCGACALPVNSKPICLCTRLAVEAEGSRIITIKGLRYEGQIIVAESVLNELERRVPSEDEVKEVLSGNFCRCGSYNNILEAVAEVGATTRMKMK